MHDGVGDGWDVVPAEWRSVEGKRVWGVIFVAEREDEFLLEGWGKDEGPVEVCDVGVMEE